MKSLLFSLIMSLFTLQVHASGCDWSSQGTPNIERIEVKAVYDIPVQNVKLTCTEIYSGHCIIQARVSGDSSVYRTEMVIGANYYHESMEAVFSSQFEELNQAHKAGQLTAKYIKENVYGTFDNNCDGPLPPLASGRFHLQLTHKETGKKWDYYFLNRLSYDLMLPLFN